jgi:ferredoxin
MAANRLFATALHCASRAPASSPSSSSSALARSLATPSSHWPTRTAPAARTLLPRPAFTSRHARPFSSTPATRHGHLDAPKPGEELHVTFIDKDAQSHTFAVSEGDNLLDIAQANDLEMEGACGGSCACSTCHVIVTDEALYDKMEEPDDDENDMLDLAFGLTETSRLGCQVKMTKDLDGLVVKLPSMTRNLQASDFQ